MQTPTRAALNAGADRFLSSLFDELRRPRDYHSIFRDEQIDHDATLTRQRLSALEVQLADNRYDALVRASAGRIAREAKLKPEHLSAADRDYLMRLTAKATYQQLQASLHRFEETTTDYEPKPLYHGPAASGTVLSANVEECCVGEQTLPLSELTELYLDFKRQQAVTASTIIEARRPLNWMLEALGGERLPATVSADQLRKLRTSFQQMDKHKQGQKGSFLTRQTENMQDWIKPQTSSKYWRTVQGLFAWLLQEGYVTADHSASLRISRRANVGVDTPDPFTNEEILQVFKTPIFAGRKHKGAYLKPGTYFERGSHWWAIMIGLHTGMRAGEMSQLEVIDVDFAADPPVFLVRREGVQGKRSKRVKTASSERSIPISPVLLQLGLADYVKRRSTGIGGKRLLPDFPLGEASGKVSSGMSHFFTRYWPAMGLWKPGRSTHVFRHTVVNNLRAQGVPDDVISAIVGHAGKTQTARYGKNTRPLTELADALRRIDYGVNIPALIDCLEPAG